MSNSDLNNIPEANVIGTTIISTAEGHDPDGFATGLAKNSLYFRLEAGDGTYNYIYANSIAQSIKNIDTIVSGKADESKLNGIQDELDNKIDVVEFNDLKTIVDTKADESDYTDFINSSDFVSRTEFESLKSSVGSKVDVTDLQSFKNDVTDSISGDGSIIGSLEVMVEENTSDIAALEKDIANLKNVSGTLTDDSTIKAIEKQIEELEKKLEADISDNATNITNINNNVKSLSSSLNALTGRVNSTNSAIDKKASNVYVQTAINDINDTLSNIQKAVVNKADLDQLSKKASKADVTVLADKINKINSTTSKVGVIESEQKKMTERFNTKANISYVDTNVADLRKDLSTKANIVDVNRNVHSIEKRLTTLEISDKNSSSELACRLDNVETNVSNIDTKYSNITDSHSDVIEYHSEQINALQLKDYELANASKTEWIKVMSPEEYDKLQNNPYYSDGVTVNPNAKQPNVIYFLTKYNRPYALYIGTVLLAKAEEQVGSSGFAYTFPIIF